VGTGSKIRIRGAGSLSGQLEPVVYVDGVRIQSGVQTGFSTGAGLVQGTSALDAIDPNDIESIEVIKGPAAATLYGADAAGGVIQIITKKGETGQGVRWTAGYEYGQIEWTLPKPTNYWLCQPEHIEDPENHPGCAGMDPNAPGEDRLLEDNPLERDYDCEWTTDCQPNPLRVGNNRELNVSASGGGDNFNFYLSGARTAEEGVFYNNNFERTSGRANFSFIPNQEFNVNVNVGYSRSDVEQPLNNNASNSILRNAFRGRAGAWNEPWHSSYRGFSPEISNQYDNQTESERTTLGLTVNYNPFTWLQNRLTLGLDKQDRLNQVFYRLDETGRAPWGAVAATGSISRFLPVTHIWTLDYAGTFDYEINRDLASSLSAGLQVNARNYESHSVSGNGLVANKLNLVSSAAERNAGQSFTQQTSAGFFVQEQLGWRDRLFGTLAVRVDDNSAFGRDFSFVAYPKAQLSYVVSDEDFFDYDYVDEMKLRFAFGRAGQAPAPFSADRTLEPTVSTIGDVAVNAIEFDSYGNPDLKAETGQEFELGFDAGFLDGRVNAEVTYYNQHTQDALVSVPDPPSTGYSGSHLINIGEIANSGLELLVNAVPYQGENVLWDATLSLATNSNELVSFGGVRDEISFGAFAAVQKHIEGYPLGGFWAVDVERDANGTPVLDESGNATVDFDNEEYVGPMLPTREIGLTNTVTLFNDLRLFSHFDYKGGNYQWCAMCSIRNRIDRNTIQVNDPNASPEQIAVWTSLQTKTHIVAADFIKLRELSATYTLPGEWVNRIGASSASFTLSGRNLWIWTKEYEDKTDFVDPEVTFYSQASFTQLDYGSMPMTRRITGSVRLTF
ncbi:MAG: SusC/RagA family TonB-linked outer membrane protein, partial [Gemmatimonadota bacterium]